MQSSVLFAPPGRRASYHRLYLVNQRSPYSRWQSNVPVCTLFSRLPQASLLRSDSFFSGAVCFVRRTLARSAFHGFSIGFLRHKSFLTQCSPYSHCQSSVHCAPSFRYSSRPRCLEFFLVFRFESQSVKERKSSEGNSTGWQSFAYMFSCSLDRHAEICFRYKCLI